MEQIEKLQSIILLPDSFSSEAKEKEWKEAFKELAELGGNSLSVLLDEKILTFKDKPGFLETMFVYSEILEEPAAAYVWYVLYKVYRWGTPFFMPSASRAEAFMDKINGVTDPEFRIAFDKAINPAASTAASSETVNTASDSSSSLFDFSGMSDSDDFTMTPEKYKEVSAFIKMNYSPFITDIAVFFAMHFLLAGIMTFGIIRILIGAGLVFFLNKYITKAATKTDMAKPLVKTAFIKLVSRNIKNSSFIGLVVGGFFALMVAATSRSWGPWSLISLVICIVVYIVLLSKVNKTVAKIVDKAC